MLWSQSWQSWIAVTNQLIHIHTGGLYFNVIPITLIVMTHLCTISHLFVRPHKGSNNFSYAKWNKWAEQTWCKVFQNCSPVNDPLIHLLHPQVCCTYWEWVFQRQQNEMNCFKMYLLCFTVHQILVFLTKVDWAPKLNISKVEQKWQEYFRN